MSEKTFIDIDVIIKIAEDFECCPICGYEHAGVKSCKKCKQKFDERETAIFFSQYLYKLKERGDLQQITKEGYEAKKNDKKIQEETSSY